jgi:membrane-associated protease RseP (regulator of RpoE activity)
MSENNRLYDTEEIKEEHGFVFKPEKKSRFSFTTNIILFIVTFFTTTFAGVVWLNQNPFDLNNFPKGLTYSILIMLVITTHEFGHYFAARFHKIPVTLPYYIPFPFFFLSPNFGTMGAVIRMKVRTQSKKSLFDIGVAGPIAGWITSLIILIIGFLTLPPITYLYSIHPEYATDGIATTGLTFGYNIIFWVFERIFSSPGVFIPPMNEIYHYPFLCVGWFGLLITALNMMPIGQLDGGHISYTMFGKKHKYLAYTFFGLLLFFGLAGFLPFLGITFELGSVMWLIWVLLILFLIKIKHPPVCYDLETPLGNTRMIIGWFSYFIFITSFCPVPVTGT